MSDLGAFMVVSGNTDRMSEKGGNMRLHPVKDGLIPMPDERGMTVRDKGGNKLIDVNNPKTGYCVGVTSPLSISGRVVQASPITGGSGPDVRFDTESARFYELVRDVPNAPIGFVVRLTTDGDESLPCTRVRVIQGTSPLSAESAAKSTSPVRKALSVREANDEAAHAVLSAMGYEGEITPQVRDAALAMIEIEKASIARLVRKGSDDPTRPISGKRHRKSIMSKKSD